MGAPELLKLIPAELRLQTSSLDDDKNAFVCWKQAFATLQKLKLPDLDMTVLNLAQGNNPFPAGADGTRLTAWLESISSCFKLIDDGIARANCQLPDPSRKGDFPYLAPARQLARMRLVNAKRLAADGKFDRAADELISVIRMGDLMASGSRCVIDFLVANAIQSIGANGIRWLSKQDGISTATLLRLLDALPEAKTNFGNCLREEYITVIFPNLVATHGDGAAENVSRRVFEIGKHINPNATTSETREQIIGVFAQHPKPLDIKHTISLFNSFVVRLCKHSSKSWSFRDTGITADIENIKKELGVELLPAIGFLGINGILYEVNGDHVLISESKLSAMKAASIKQENPLGKMVLCVTIPIISRVVLNASRARADREATRLCLALQLFKSKEHNLPDSLGALLTSKILTAIPDDPFSERPFRYSHDRRIIWSVGEDEIDDEGAGDSKTVFGEKDYIWSLDL